MELLIPLYIAGLALYFWLRSEEKIQRDILVLWGLLALPIVVAIILKRLL